MTETASLRRSLKKNNRKIISRPVRKYDRYFEGYTEYREMGKNGKKGRIVRLYTADYYKPDLSRTGIFAVKLMYLAALVGAAALFLFGALTVFDGRGAWTIALADAIALACLAAFGISVFNNIIAAEKRTVYIYKISSEGMKKRAVCAAAALFLDSMTLSVSVLASGARLSGTAALCALSYLAAAGLSLGVYLTERRVNYIRVPSGNTAPDDAEKLELKEVEA